MSLINYLVLHDDDSKLNDEMTLLRNGWGVLRSRPDVSDSGQVLWQDLMNAIGHGSSLLAGAKSPNRSQTKAFCWLATSGIKSLVITAANFLTPFQVGDLSSMASALGIKLWLIYDVAPRDERKVSLLRLQPQLGTIDDFLNLRSLSPFEVTHKDDLPMVQVPQSHFLQFLEICAETLSTEDFQKALSLAEKGKSEMLERFDIDQIDDKESIALALHQISSEFSDINEIRCIIQGASIAAFLRGWSIKLDLTRWVERGSISELSMYLGPKQLAALSKLQNSCFLAICILSVLGISPDAMQAVSTEEFNADVSTLHFNGRIIEIPNAFRNLLITQMIFRNLIGDIENPFLVQGPKEHQISPRWIGDALRLITGETGVPLRGSTARRRPNNGADWFSRGGIKVLRLSK